MMMSSLSFAAEFVRHSMLLAKVSLLVSSMQQTTTMMMMLMIQQADDIWRTKIDQHPCRR
jgi:hypothetical protein